MRIHPGDAARDDDGALVRGARRKAGADKAAIGATGDADTLRPWANVTGQRMLMRGRNSLSALSREHPPIGSL